MSDAQKAGTNLVKGLHLAGPARGFPWDTSPAGLSPGVTVKLYSRHVRRGVIMLRLLEEISLPQR
jgi:hypothetical protein